MTYAVPDEVIANIEAVVREGRTLQGNWRTKDAQGRELVCALAAFGPNINSAVSCPKDYMPRWLAELIPTLDDGIAPEAVDGYYLGLARRAGLWSRLDDTAWERVRVGFLVGCIRQALEDAEKVQPTPRPGYWNNVQDACSMVIAALEGRGDLKAAADAARWNAVDAAAAAAAAAADAAAAAAAADARWGARQSAYSRLVSLLFGLLDVEISAGREGGE